MKREFEFWAVDVLRVSDDVGDQLDDPDKLKFLLTSVSQTKLYIPIKKSAGNMPSGRLSNPIAII